MIQAKFGLNWSSGFRREDFLKSLQMDGCQVMAIPQNIKKHNFLQDQSSIKYNFIQMHIF
jgi:hypothetical protein